ncbi:MAG: 50S ribosomal protein L18e [DPANN group archaeon]|nr:50S ribosomal protein L18e [DPANN group archaeon]
MGKPTGPTNPITKNIVNILIKASKDNKVNIWKDIAERLNKSSRIRPVVNIAKIEKYTNKGDYVIVPGKLLAVGTLTKEVTISAWNASESAIKKINDAKSTYITLQEMIKQNPKGKNIKILA